MIPRNCRVERTRLWEREHNHHAILPVVPFDLQLGEPVIIRLPCVEFEFASSRVPSFGRAEIAAHARAPRAGLSKLGSVAELYALGCRRVAWAGRITWAITISLSATAVAVMYAHAAGTAGESE